MQGPSRGQQWARSGSASCLCHAQVYREPAKGSLSNRWHSLTAQSCGHRAGQLAHGTVPCRQMGLAAHSQRPGRVILGRCCRLCH